MRPRLMCLLMILCPIAVFGQYIEQWAVEQDYYEWGFLPFDYNHDGAADLTKLLGNNMTVYDGTNGYSVLWSVTADNFDLLTIWDRYELSEGTEYFILIPNMSFASSSFTLRAYEALADQPVWSSESMAGEISWLDAGNLDDESGLELVFGRNEYIAGEQNYVSQFYIFNAATGMSEFDSGELSGYMAGPYAGDLDLDGRDDILINLYDLVNQTSTLHAWRFNEAFVRPEGNLLPLEIRLGQNYPNPFNPSTRIPIRLVRPSEVEVNVINTLGQRVKQILCGRLGAGDTILGWDGRDDSGQAVASGLYLCEVITDGHRVERPMVLLR